MTIKIFHHSTISIAITQLISFGSVAHAQTDDALGFTLEEVIVTAQRRSESLQDAAIPISAATADELMQAGVDNASTLNNVAPSLFVVAGGGANASYFIRGVGNFTNNGYSDPAIAFNLDGVYVGRPTSTVGAFLDLERVEVLKGPQGTLYGRNATAGAINLIPIKPRLGETSGYLQAGAGNLDRFEVTGAFNTALTDSSALRIAATALKDDGYFDDGTSIKDDWAVRIQYLSELNDVASLRLSLDYAEASGTGPGRVVQGNYSFNPTAGANENDIAGSYSFVPAPDAVAEPFTGLHTDASQAYVQTIATTPAFTTLPGHEYPGMDNNYLGFTAEFNTEIGESDLVLIGAYREGNIDSQFNGPGFRAAIVDEKSDQVSLEARLTGATGIVDWILGGFYYEETVDGNSAYSQFSVNSIQDYVTESESLATFIRATVNVSDSLRLVGGVRYTKDDKSINAFTTNLIEICSSAPPNGPGCFGGPVLPAELTVEEAYAAIPASLLPAGTPTIPGQPVPYGAQGNLLFFVPIPNNDNLTDDEASFRLAVEYDITADNLLYASFENGYRSGGYSQSFGHETFGPEFIDAYTIGSKNRFMDDRLQINAELFYWEYTDQQVSHFGFDALQNNSYFTENIGESTIQGLDIDLQYQATAALLVKGSVQYLDSKLDSFSYETPALSPLPPVTGCDFAPGVNNDGLNVWNVDCSGQPGYNSPEWTMNIGLQYEANIGDYMLVTNLDARYRDERVIGFEYTPYQYEDSVVTGDLNITLAPLSDNWFLSIYVNNISDEEIRSLADVFGNASYIGVTSYQPPRTYGLRVGMEF